MSERCYVSTSGRGLDYEHPAWKLYEKSKKLGVWNPADIDLSQDRQDWARLTGEEKDVLLRLTALFTAGEESVVQELLPLMWVISKEQRLEEEMFLAAFLFEEAKHVETFRRFVDAIACHEGDLSHYHTPQYKDVFYQALPEAMAALMTDSSPVAQARASATYNMIVEGVLAETGYHAYHTILTQGGIMPGMVKLVELVKRDESRHLAYGLFLLSRLIQDHGQSVWQAIEERMSELLGPAIGVIEELFGCYDPMPFGLSPEVFIDFATRQFQSRMDHLERQVSSS
jgi:ribonucleoside-diphosphate reductase beta chain